MPSANSIGEVLNLAVRRVLSGVRRYLMTAGEVDEWVTAEIPKRLTGVAPDRIALPVPEVAIPALMAVAYTHAEELRAMFASLIARSMDMETAGKVHPSFVEVIKQLTPGEARILRVVELGPATFYLFPFDYNGDSVSAFDDFGVTGLFEMAGGDFSGGRGQVAIDNLRRLKLVRYSHEDSDMVESDQFREIPDLPFTAAQRSCLRLSLSQQGENGYIYVNIRRLALTSFGENFCAVCLDKPTA